MKRKSWEEKLTPEGRALLELRRRIYELQAAAGLFPDGVDPARLDQTAELSERIHAAKQDYARQFPKTKVIELRPEFVALFPMMSLKAGPNCFSQGIAESLESAQELAVIFENDLQLRGFAYLMIAAIGGRVLDAFKSAQRRLPEKPDSPEKVQAWFGRSLEMLGKMIQGKSTPKGKMDFELIDLIQMIREHQTEKLSWEDVRQALAFAGYHKADAEGLRVFAARARKKGLL